VTGFDFSGVRIHPASETAGALGVQGLTVGHDVHLAPGVTSADTADGRHVLAHDLAHVAQQATGQNRQAHERALESDAERIAGLAASAVPSRSSLRPLPSIARPSVHAFDPEYHRKSVVEGLKGTPFSAEEVGRIYQANWERDYSQAHPAIGRVVQAWKAVKISALEGKGQPGAAPVEAFHAATSALASLARSNPGELANGEAFGGYAFYEHMDNPLSGEDKTLTLD
jgi:hypothetical protein